MITPFKLPDNKVPIKVGDDSYIYKDVYNPIEWFGGEPYRPRVETLVLQNNGTHVYAHVTKKGYRIPGGSTDKDSTYEKQAENETNEEALIGVKDLKYSGISYSRAMDRDFIKKGGDSALAYVGSLNYVYVANWDGMSIDKSTIEEKDLDDDMAQKGAWHRIEELDLDREHMEALVNSGMLDKRVELVLRHKLDKTSYISNKRLIFENGNDLGPLKKRYIFHGSLHKFDIFHPMSLDLGNNEEKPGWSTFCFDDYEFAKRFTIMRAMQKLTDHLAEKNPVYRVGWDLRNARPYISKKVASEIFAKLQSIPLYIYTIDASKLELGVGNDERYPEYTFRKDNVPYEVREVVYVDRYSAPNDVTLLDGVSAEDFEKEQMENLPNLNRGWMARMLNRDYSGDSAVTKLTSAVAKGDLKPGDDVEEYMRKHGIVLKNVGYYAHLQENMVQGPTNKEMTIYLGDNRMLMSPTNYNDNFNVDDIDEVLPPNSQLDNRDVEKYRYYMYLMNNGGNNDIVGYCDVIDMAVADESDRRYYVVRVFVVPRCRRLGLGDVLANYAIRYIISDLDNGDCNATLVMVDKKVSAISGIDNWIKSKGLLKGVPVEGSYEGTNHIYTRVFSKAFPENIKQYKITDDVVEEAVDFSKKVSKSIKLYHASPKQNMKYIEPKHESVNKIVGRGVDAIYASDDPRFSACFGVEWHDDVAKQGSWDNWGTVTFGVSDKVDLTKPCSMYELENDGSFTQIKTKEFIVTHKVKVKREIKFNTGMDMLKAYGVEVITLDEYRKRLTMEGSSAKRNLKLSSFKNQKLTNALVDKYKTNDSVLCELEPYNLGDGNIWFDGDEYVAACSVEYKLLDRFNWITAIEVAAPYRGSGLGKQVLDYAVKTLKGNTISVWKKNEVALNMYKKYGFKISKASEEQVKSGGSSMYFMYLPSALSKEDIDEVNNVTMGPVKEGTVFDLTDDDQIEDGENTIVEESWEDNKLLKPIYIILTYAGTRFGKVITAWQHCKFSHAGLSLNSKMDKVYTFNMRTEVDDNGKKKIMGGADVENLDDYHNPAENNDADICVMAMFVTPDVHDMIKKNIEKIFAVADKTRYSISNVINVVLNRAVDTKDSMKMICSQFVDYILKQSNIDISNKSSNITTPNDFYKAANSNPNIFLLYDGKKSGYNHKSVDRKIGHLRHSDKYSDINITKALVVEAFTVYKEGFQKGKPYKLSSFNKTPISKQALDKFKQQELCRELLHIDDYDTGYIYTDKDTGAFVAVIAVDKSADRKYNWITAVEVGKDYQGHGLARQLLDVATKELGGNALSAHSENRVAIETYKKYGFRESEESKNRMRTRVFMYYGSALKGFEKDVKKVMESMVDCTMETVYQDVVADKEWYYSDANGIQNCLVKVDGIKGNLRGRGEMIIFDKNHTKIFLCKVDKGSLYYEFGYRLPGGSFEPNEAHIDGVRREVSEEVLMLCDDVRDTGIRYAFTYDEPADWVKEKIPKDAWWYGSYVEVFCGTYSGKFTGTVNDADVDAKMLENGKWYPINKSTLKMLTNWHKKAVKWYLNDGLMESLNLLLEADVDDEDEDEATDYTSQVDGEDADDSTEEPDTTEAEATSDGDQANDYTDDTEADGANDYTSDATDGEDAGEDTSSEVDGSAGTDEDTIGDEGTDDDDGDVGASGADGEDAGATDYTNMDGDSGSEDTSSDDSTSYDDSSTETDNQTINNRIKNYSILKDFERLYRLANEIGEALDPVIMEKPIQNKVVTQVKENILAIKEAIMWFVQYGASSKYSYNLYYYEIFMSALKINVQILEKNKKFSEELKNKMKPKKVKEASQKWQDLQRLRQNTLYLLLQLRS